MTSHDPKQAAVHNQISGYVERLTNIARMEAVTAVFQGPVTLQTEGAVARQRAAPESIDGIPRDIADFTGRQTEIEAVTSALTPAIEGSAPAVVAIAGMPGVGKSTLAIRAAQLLKSQYPGPRLYVELRKSDGTQRDAFDVLGMFLESLLGIGAQLPDSLEGRVRTYRNELAGTRGLILLDNAHDAEQVESLIPSSWTCAVIITSRRQLTALPGARCVRVPVMRADEASALLGRLAGGERVDRDPAVAAQIVTLCGNLPLALRIAGGTLAEEPYTSLAEYRDRLADERRRLEALRLEHHDVRASIHLSVRDLAPDEMCLFRRLALLAGRDCVPAVAAALLGVDPATAEAAIRRLARFQLLVPKVGSRLGLHDLVRLVAREELARAESAEEQRVVRDRLGDWYATEATHMAEAIGGHDRRPCVQAALDSDPSIDADVLAATRRALDWFETEQIEIDAAIEHAAATGAWARVLALAGACLPADRLRARWRDAARRNELALVAGRHQGNHRDEAAALANLGNSHLFAGRWQAAVDCYEQSDALMQAIGEGRSAASVVTNLGIAFQNLRRWVEAERCYKQSLIIHRENGDPEGEARALSNLGTLEDHRGRSAEALACHEQSLAISKGLGDSHGIATALGNIGNAYARQGRWDDALRYYEQSLSLLQSLGDRHGIGQSLSSLGLVYMHKQDWPEAVRCFSTDVDICRELGDQPGEAISLSNLGDAFIKQQRWDDAGAAYERSVDLSRAIGDRTAVAKTLRLLAIIRMKQGRWDDTRDCFEESLQIARTLSDADGEELAQRGLGILHQASLTVSRETHDRAWEAVALNNLATVYESQGKWGEAVDAYTKSAEICQELGNHAHEGLALRNLGNVFRAQLRWTDAIAAYRKSLAVRRASNDRHGEAETLYGIGINYFLQSQWKKARNAFEKCLAIRRGLADRSGAGDALFNLGVVYLQLQDLQKAFDASIESLAIAREGSDRHVIGQRLVNLAELYRRSAQMQDFIASLQEALTYLDPASPQFASVEEALQTATTASARPSGAGKKKRTSR